jgi:2-amino-4-hydroxy-6-hydroxymethyldihydropteridine diphosphokinase
MFRAYLGLGANLGNPQNQLAQAIAEMARDRRIRVLKVSSLYRTLPMGGEPQPEFLNAAVSLETSLTPRALLALGQRCEIRAGRTPGRRNAPRELDIDLLLYAGQILAEPDLTVPHPRLTERAFALIPLAEIASEVRHPLRDQTIAELAAQVSGQGVWRTAGGSRWANL